MLYPSAPRLLVSWTAERFPGFRVLTELPAKLQEVLATPGVGAVVRVQRYGGPRAVTLDRPLVDCDVFAAGSDAAESFSIADAACGVVCSAWEWSMPGAFIDVGTDGRAAVARVAITSGPSQRPTTDPMLRRVGFSAQVVLHARP